MLTPVIFQASSQPAACFAAPRLLSTACWPLQAAPSLLPPACCPLVALPYWQRPVCFPCLLPPAGCALLCCMTLIAVPQEVPGTAVEQALTDAQPEHTWGFQLPPGSKLTVVLDEGNAQHATRQRKYLLLFTEVAARCGDVGALGRAAAFLQVQGLKAPQLGDLHG